MFDLIFFGGLALSAIGIIVFVTSIFASFLVDIWKEAYQSKTRRVLRISVRLLAFLGVLLTLYGLIMGHPIAKVMAAIAWGLFAVAVLFTPPGMADRIHGDE